MLSFLFLHFLLHIIPLSIIGTCLNIYTKGQSNGTLSNTKTHMRDATECINSIGYALFAVIKVSKGEKIKSSKAIFSNPNGLEMLMNYIFKGAAT